MIVFAEDAAGLVNVIENDNTFTYFSYIMNKCHISLTKLILSLKTLLTQECKFIYIILCSFYILKW